MKLRFRGNTLRLRVNRREVDALASGDLVQENVLFPNQTCFTYIFEPSGNATPHASFESNTLRVAAPLLQVKDWARAEVIGLYYNFETEGTVLKVAIEKDLECTDSTSEDQDPDAFPRPKGNNC
jgi:Family of unknown function (DUF7009)